MLDKLFHFLESGWLSIDMSGYEKFCYLYNLSHFPFSVSQFRKAVSPQPSMQLTRKIWDNRWRSIALKIEKKNVADTINVDIVFFCHFLLFFFIFFISWKSGVHLVFMLLFVSWNLSLNYFFFLFLCYF